MSTLRSAVARRRIDRQEFAKKLEESVEDTNMSATQLKNGVRAWHEELLEFLLVNPRASLQEIAIYFNASISWISIVRNSDAFKELYARRRDQHFDRVSITVSDRVTALADVTIDALTFKMEKHIAANTATIEQLKEV